MATYPVNVATWNFGTCFCIYQAKRKWVVENFWSHKPWSIMHYTQFWKVDCISFAKKQKWYFFVMTSRQIHTWGPSPIILTINQKLSWLKTCSYIVFWSLQIWKKHFLGSWARKFRSEKLYFWFFFVGEKATHWSCMPTSMNSKKKATFIIKTF